MENSHPTNATIAPIPYPTWGDQIIVGLVVVLLCTLVQNESSFNTYPIKNQFNRWGLCNMGGSCWRENGFSLEKGKKGASVLRYIKCKQNTGTT